MEGKLFLARVEDTLNICQRTNKPKFLGFLSAEQAILAQRFLENRRAEYRFFGGYDNAQRVLLGCFPDWTEEFNFPITAVSFTFRNSDILRHRDFLGALMALGITRETVGDILVENGRAVVFLSSEIKNFVINNLDKIGATGVTVREGFVEPLPETDALTEMSVTMASSRLDCTVAALCSVSRNTADELITGGLVAVNSVICEKTTKIICEGDIVTVRGKGKFIIESLSGRTKKDRVVLIYKKYF